MIDESYQKLFVYIKSRIDNAIKEAKEKNLNGIDRFTYIMKSYWAAALEYHNIDWDVENASAFVSEVIPPEMDTYFITYLDSYFQDVDKEILKIIRKIDEAKTVDDLLCEVDELNELLNKSMVVEYNSTFRCLPIHEKGIQKKKDLKN